VQRKIASFSWQPLFKSFLVGTFLDFLAFELPNCDGVQGVYITTKTDQGNIGTMPCNFVAVDWVDHREQRANTCKNKNKTSLKEELKIYE